MTTTANNTVSDLAQAIYRACLSDGAGNSPQYWAWRFGKGMTRKERAQAIHSAIHWLRAHEIQQREAVLCR